MLWIETVGQLREFVAFAMVFRSSLAEAVSKKLLATLCIVVIYGLFALYRVGWTDLTSDEGRYGLVAVNILTDHRQLACLSEDPLGAPGSKPFMYAVSLAASVRLLGKTEFALRFVSVAALLGAGLLLLGVVDSFLNDRWLPLLTLLFFLLNPWTISYARSAMPEPTLVFWGSLALFSAARFSRNRDLPSAFVCGLTLGFAFLTKLWLVFPFALASLVIFSAAYFVGPKPRVAVAALLASSAFILTCVSHLLLVLWWTPSDFRHWLQLYFVVSFSSRVAGEGQDTTMWFHPWWFYLAGLFKATFFALPLVYLAVYTLLRQGNRLLVAVLAAMLSPFLILSLFTVKQTSYVFPAFPAVAFLLAYGTLLAFRSRPAKPLVVATVLSAATALFFFSLYAITPKELALICGLYLLYIIVSLAGQKYILISEVALASSALAAMLIASVLAVTISLAHRTYYREIAAYFRPSLAHYAPQTVVFQAPEFAALEFYLFRSGQYWQTYYFHQSYHDFLEKLKNGAIVFYVVDPNGELYGGKLSPEKLNALHEYATDETLEVERAVGKKIPVQVLVPRGESCLQPSGGHAPTPLTSSSPHRHAFRSGARL